MPCGVARILRPRLRHFAGCAPFFYSYLPTYLPLSSSSSSSPSSLPLLVPSFPPVVPPSLPPSPRAWLRFYACAQTRVEHVQPGNKECLVKEEGVIGGGKLWGDEAGAGERNCAVKRRWLREEEAGRKGGRQGGRGREKRRKKKWKREKKDRMESEKERWSGDGWKCAKRSRNACNTR